MEVIQRLVDIEHFNDAELSSNRPVPLHKVENILPTAKFLDNIRRAIDTPIIIRSGYRDPEANRGVGGSPRSMHMEFNALDFKPSGFGSRQLAELVVDIINGKYSIAVYWKGKLVTITPELMGIGYYGINHGNFIHIDTRGLLGKPAAEWQYI